MLNNEGLFKRHFTGEEEVWLLKSGITAMMADKLIYIRSS